MIESESFYECLENIQRGIDIKLAMQAFGIDGKQLEPWHKKEMLRAKAQATIAMQATINEHGTEDWRALQWIIERNNKDKDDEKQLREILNRQIAKELAKGLIESTISESNSEDQGHTKAQQGESESFDDSERPRGVLRLPKNYPDSSTDGDI